jgi:hypothetical protein
MRFIITILFYLSSFMYLTDSAIVPCNDCYRIVTTLPNNYALQKNISDELIKIKTAVTTIEKILILHVQKNTVQNTDKHHNILSHIKQTEEYRSSKLKSSIKK